MTIIQEQPSSNGWLKSNEIRGVISAYATNGMIPGATQTEPGIELELPFGKRYFIGRFPSVEARDKCVNYIYDNRFKTSIILSLEEFFEEDYLNDELITHVLAEYTIRDYLINLFKTKMKNVNVYDAVKMDAFSMFPPAIIYKMMRGGDVNLNVVSNLYAIWARTLPMNEQLRKFSISKFKYFYHLIKKNNEVNPHIRIISPY